MSSDLLGKHFDIHGGGQDLQFPHHENEIAQSGRRAPVQFVNYWMHNGFVRVDDERCPSLGNFFTIREGAEEVRPEVVRFFILRAHYRSPLNYSDMHLDDARHALGQLYTSLKGGAGDDVRGGLERGACTTVPRWRWTTTSIRRRRVRFCSIWRRGQPQQVCRAGGPTEGARRFAWDCSNAIRRCSLQATPSGGERLG